MIPGYTREELERLKDILREDGRIYLLGKIHEQWICDWDAEKMIEKYLDFVNNTPFDRMPLYLESGGFYSFAKWRLEIGK